MSSQTNKPSIVPQKRHRHAGNMDYRFYVSGHQEQGKRTNPVNLLFDFSLLYLGGEGADVNSSVDLV